MVRHFANSNILSQLFQWSSAKAYQRIIVVILGFSLLFLVISYQLLNIVLNEEDDTIQYNNTFKITRREIIDRNNNIIATNIPSVSLYANPQKIIDPEDAAKQIATILPDLEYKKLLSELKKNKSFRWLKRDLSRKEQLAIHSLGLPGIYFEQELRRVYPYGRMTSHILGYVGRDYSGLAGIERYFNDKLLLPVKEASHAEPLQLSLDARVQTIVHEELSHVIKKFKAKGGVCIITDPNNGEIISMVSLPDFDPYKPGKAKPEELFNQASLGVYEVGSVMKPLTIAISFDTSSSNLYDLYNLSPMKVSNFRVKDYHKNEGWHSVAEIFLHSSNIGVAQMALEVGEATFKKYLKRLGMLSTTSVELPEKGRPLYPKLEKKWNDLSLVTMSYGYGLSVTPLHFMQAMVPTINGGKMHPLTLLHDAEAPQDSPQVLHEDTSKNINKLLRVTVKQGTGRKAQVPGYYLGAKTGTANKRKDGRYVNDSRMSSFVASFPAHKPQYLLYMLLDDPKGNKDTFGFATGGWTAAPAIGKIVERIVTLYGQAPYDSNDPEIIELEDIIVSAENNV